MKKKLLLNAIIIVPFLFIPSTTLPMEAELPTQAAITQEQTSFDAQENKLTDLEVFSLSAGGTAREIIAELDNIVEQTANLFSSNTNDIVSFDIDENILNNSKQEQQVLEPIVTNLTIEQQPSTNSSTDFTIQQVKTNFAAVLTEITAGQTENNAIDTSLCRSRIVTPAPTKKGLPLAWLLSLRSTNQELLLASLKDSSFDPENIDYLDQLNNAIYAFAEDATTDQLIEVINVAGTTLAGKVKPEEVKCQIAHTHLTKVHQQKLSTLETALTELNTERLAKLNALLSVIKTEYASFVGEAQKIDIAYNAELDRLVDASCSTIRASKQALCNLHLLNGTLTLDKSGYCSDYEQEKKDGHGVIKNPKAVSNFYDNGTIVQKIGMTQPIKDTRKQMVNRLNALANINNELQQISPTSPAISQTKIV